jgi:hypothetical protein
MLSEFGASHLNNSAGSSLLSRIPNHAWQGRAHTLLPEPPKDGTFADSGRLQPVLKRQGGSIEHRLVRGRGRGDASLLGLAVLEAVSARVMAVVLRGRSPRLTAARAARLSTVRTAGCSQGLGYCLSRCAVDSTETRWRTEAKVHGPGLAFFQAGSHQRGIDCWRQFLGQEVIVARSTDRSIDVSGHAAVCTRNAFRIMHIM